MIAKLKYIRDDLRANAPKNLAYGCNFFECRQKEYGVGVICSVRMDANVQQFMDRKSNGEEALPDHWEVWSKSCPDDSSAGTVCQFHLEQFHQIDRYGDRKFRVTTVANFTPEHTRQLYQFRKMAYKAGNLLTMLPKSILTAAQISSKDLESIGRGSVFGGGRFDSNKWYQSWLNGMMNFGTNPPKGYETGEVFVYGSDYCRRDLPVVSAGIWEGISWIGVDDIFSLSLDLINKLIELCEAESIKPEEDSEADQSEADVEPPETEPFVLNELQISIRAALDGVAMQVEQLAKACRVATSRLYKDNGIHELKEHNLVDHRDGVGYFRPDSLPPEAILIPKATAKLPKKVKKPAGNSIRKAGKKKGKRG
ncbi:MAG: hypothetical protein O3A84_09450 [Proteobacteria bacterium]|nr:hypothetical protein [Pseudomonadota bacterium]